MPGTLEQRLDALGRARWARTARCELRLELAAGVIDMADAIHDQRADGLEIFRLLCAVRGIGPYRARHILARLMISEQRRCCELTLRQKGVIVAAVNR